ncbi:hypothetical protein LTR27_008647 [Elasticomyces elasticus]|nr:hypothetical protein LTR27_008647 [Elasticomyces elasticus]
MAGLTSSSRLQDPEFFDYSRSHRAVPVPPRTSISKRRSPPQHYTTEEEREREVLERSSSRKRDRLLHRVSHSNLLNKPTSSPTRFDTVQTGNYHTRSESSSEPGTRLGESDLTPSFPAPPGNYHPTQNNNALQRNFSKKVQPPAATTTMLRKFSSSGRQDARNALQQQQQNQTPHSPYQTPQAPPPQLPNIHDFHDDNARPDSFGIFGSQTPSAPPSSALPSPPPAAANFSRPSGASTMSQGRENSSSSPAYVARTGNAFAQQASSSPSSTSMGGGVGGESMAHRGRMSYAGTNNSQTGGYGHGSTGVGGGGGGVVSPRRIRRRKDPTPFNILVIGAKNSGKTSFISFLQHSFSLPNQNQNNHTSAHHTTSPTLSSSHLHTTSHKSSSASFTPTFLESEIDGERIGLTLWDSAGLEKHIIDLQLREISTFVEQKFEETFVEEQKVNRAPGVKDTHIHCVLLVLDPVRLDGTIAGTVGSVGGGMKGGEGKEGLMVEGLDEDMDLQVLRALWGKTTVIPVVSKGDTVTTGHMRFLKRAVWRSVKGAKLDPLEALELDDEEDEEEDEDGEDGEGDGTDEGAIAEEDDEEGSDVVGNGRGGGSEEEDGSSASDSSPDLPTAKVVKRGTNGHTRQSSLANTGVTANGGGGAMMMEEEPYIPFSILSPDTDSYPTQHHSLHNQNTPIHPNNGRAAVKVGRHFPWGFADPNDPLHCDFTRLRDSVFSEWRSDLRDLARTKWYENWRTSRLKNLPGTGRQRVNGRGGITPVAVVPKEGRSVGGQGRLSSTAAGGAAGGYGGGNGGLGGENVPRSVSSGGEGGKGKVGGMMGIPSQQEGMSGSGSVSVGRASGGMMRGVESYQ